MASYVFDSSALGKHYHAEIGTAFVDALVQGMPRIDLPESEAVRFRHGVAVPAPGTAPGCAVVYASGSLLGLADVDEGLARPARLVVPPAPGEAVSS